MRIEVAANQLGAQEYGRLVPGSRVEYNGKLWKIVGMYFGSPRGPAYDAASLTKYLVLQSLDLNLENLRPPLGAVRMI